MSPIELSPMHGSALADHPDLFTSSLAVWLSAFAGPPWHATPDQLDGRRQVARRQLTRDGARAVVAYEDGDVVGAVWGWSGDRSPADELHHAVRTATGPELAARLWRPDVAVIVELMVDPAYQGNGIGGRLLDSFVADRSSWLLSHPDGAGLALYRRRGWREAARIDHGATPLLVLVRDPTGVCP